MTIADGPGDQPEGLLYSEYATFARLPEWVLDAPISDRAVRLFAVLLRHADKGGKAFPSRPRIAARLKPRPDDADASWKPLSTDSVDRAIAELVEIGAMRVQRNGGRPGEPWKTNTYWLLRQPDPSRTPAATPSRSTAATLAAPVRNEREVFTESPPSLAPLAPPPPTGGAEPTRKRRASTGERTPEFEAWYAAYPLHKGPVAAAKAYAKALRIITTTRPEVIPAKVLLEAAQRFRDDPTRDPAFTPHPATWLNAGRWEDEGPAREQSTEVALRGDAGGVDRFAAAEARAREAERLMAQMGDV